MRLRFCRHKCVIWCSIEWTTKGPAVKFKYVNAINWWIYAFEVDFTCFSRYIILLRRSCGQSGCNLSRHLCHFTWHRTHAITIHIERKQLDWIAKRCNNRWSVIGNRQKYENQAEYAHPNCLQMLLAICSTMYNTRHDTLLMIST